MHLWMFYVTLMNHPTTAEINKISRDLIESAHPPSDPIQRYAELLDHNEIIEIEKDLREAECISLRQEINRVWELVHEERTRRMRYQDAWRAVCWITPFAAALAVIYVAVWRSS